VTLIEELFGRPPLNAIYVHFWPDWSIKKVLLSGASWILSVLGPGELFAGFSFVGLAQSKKDAFLPVPVNSVPKSFAVLAHDFE
jgi:hypothetical protein